MLWSWGDIQWVCRKTTAIRQKLEDGISLPRGEQRRSRQGRSSRDWELVGLQGRESGPRDSAMWGLGYQNWDTRLQPVWQPVWADAEAQTAWSSLFTSFLPELNIRGSLSLEYEGNEGRKTRNLGSLTHTKSISATRYESCRSFFSCKIFLILKTGAVIAWWTLSWN